MNISKSSLKNLVYQVNGVAIEVHREIGPGLLESVYHACIIKELTIRNIYFESELNVPVAYKGLSIDTDLRCDLLIEEVLVVELKAIQSVLPIHEAQLLTYMRLLNAPIGLLINFNVTHIFKEGQKTYVNELFRELPL